MACAYDLGTADYYRGVTTATVDGVAFWVNVSGPRRPSAEDVRAAVEGRDDLTPEERDAVDRHERRAFRRELADYFRWLSGRIERRAKQKTQSCRNFVANCVFARKRNARARHRHARERRSA